MKRWILDTMERLGRWLLRQVCKRRGHRWMIIRDGLFSRDRHCRRCGDDDHGPPPPGFNCRCHPYSSFEISSPRDSCVNLDPI